MNDLSSCLLVLLNFSRSRVVFSASFLSESLSRRLIMLNFSRTPAILIVQNCRRVGFSDRRLASICFYIMMTCVY